jgi:hypothetical protein
LRRTNLLKRKGGYMRKIAFIVSMLICLTMLIIIGFPYVGECAEYETDTDRPGMDYHCYDLPTDDWTAGTSCKSDCEGDSRCIAWTYVKPNTTKGPHALCCKKSSLPAKKADTCCISGVKPCPPINITSPPSTPNQTYFINQTLPIAWNTSNIKNYGTVFLSVVQYDIEHMDGSEGGGFPVANTGSYQWMIPANVGPTSLCDEGFCGVGYAVKVVTPDGRCVGQSVKFSIKKKIFPMEKMKKINISP